MNALNYLIHALISLYFFFVVARFLLQTVKADFYNPFSQATVKITNPLLKPLRTVIPGFYGIDFASIALIFLIQLIHAEVLALLNVHSVLNIASVLAFSIFGTIMFISWIIWVCAIGMIIMSWVAPYSTNPMLMLARQVLQPFLNPLQKLLPPMGGLDFSVMLLLIFNVALEKLITEIVMASDPAGSVFPYIIGF